MKIEVGLSQSLILRVGDLLGVFPVCSIKGFVLQGIFAIWVIRYFVREQERLLEDHKKARHCYQESLRGIVKEQSATNAKLLACLGAEEKSEICST